MNDGWCRGITNLLTIVDDANVAIDRLLKYEEKKYLVFPRLEFKSERRELMKIIRHNILPQRSSSH
jgi:hypothetical protein